MHTAQTLQPRCVEQVTFARLSRPILGDLYVAIERIGDEVDLAEASSGVLSYSSSSPSSSPPSSSSSSSWATGRKPRMSVTALSSVGRWKPPGAGGARLYTSFTRIAG